MHRVACILHLRLVLVISLVLSTRVSHLQISMTSSVSTWGTNCAVTEAGLTQPRFALPAALHMTTWHHLCYKSFSQFQPLPEKPKHKLGQLLPVNTRAFWIYSGLSSLASLEYRVVITAHHFTAQQIPHSATTAALQKKKYKKSIYAGVKNSHRWFTQGTRTSTDRHAFWQAVFFLLVDRKTSVMYTVFICKRCNESTLHLGQNIFFPLLQQAPQKL